MQQEKPRILKAVLLSLLACTYASAEELPLFASGSPLDIVLELPLNTIMKQSKKRPVVAGQLSYFDSVGQQVSFDVKITTRGNSRLEVCSFPPLAITMKKKHVAGTLFEGQKKLKIVTHCKHSSETREYRQFLLQEYSIYRAFNALSDISFRVRLLHISYRNTEKSGRATDAYAFLIESIEEVASRVDLERQKVSSVPQSRLDPGYATMTALFQFLIGNTDWSILQGAGDDRCCHNGRVLSPAGAESGWKVVPYDFDQAGLINTPYAQPNPRLRIRTVRQRIYRGRCAFLEKLEPAVRLYNDRRGDLESILVHPDMSPSRRRYSLGYVEDFYKIINDDKQLQTYVERGCMGPKL